MELLNRTSVRKSLQSAKTVLIVTAVVCSVLGFLCGQFLDAESDQHITSSKLQLIFRDPEQQQSYTVFSSKVWHSTDWGRNCSDGVRVEKGLGLLCQLPSIWQDCSAGIYIDVGTNVGVQMRKLYNPWQFPGALVLDLFTTTYGHDRSKVCALGIEANPAHSAFRTLLNAYFRRKGYQALVLTETAASVGTGQATFHQDPAVTHELGASLASGSWQKQTQQRNTAVTVPLFDLPAFLADIVRPLAQEIQWRTGSKPAQGMKIDAEGEEYALLPALITNGGLCDLSMIYIEPHKKSFRTDAGKAVGMLLPAMEKAFDNMRKANPRCTVNYTHLDDETYMHADIEIPLDP